MHAHGSRVLVRAAALVLVAGALGAQTRPLAGLVVDAEGDPAGGSVVEVRWLAHPELPAAVGHAQDDVARAEVRADGRGRFRYEPPHQGPFLLIARRDGRESEQAFPVVPGDFARLELGAPFEVRGVVRDGGAPAAGVEVRTIATDLHSAWRRGAYRYPDVPVRTRTDADGRFVLPFERGYLRHPIWYPLRGVIAIAADGRTSGLSDVVRPVESSRALELVLGAPAARVRVVDARGQPVVGARLLDPRLTDLDLRTDADGRANLPFPGGVVAVVADGYEMHELALDPDGTRENVARLTPAGRLLVGVVRVGGAPLKDARVLVSIPTLPGPPHERMMATSDAGSFELRGLIDGAVAYLFVEVDGRFRPLLRAHGPGAAYAAIDVPAPRRIEGQMLDTHGVPAGHARVAIRVEGWPPWVTWTDHAGRFRFDVALPPGRAVELVGQADGRGVAKMPLARDADGPLVLRAVPGHTLEGVVLDEDGAPVARAFVTMAYSTGAGADMPGPADRMAAQVVYSDADGRFRFEGLDLDSDPTVLAIVIRDGVRLQGSAIERWKGGEQLTLEVTVRPTDG